MTIDTKIFDSLISHNITTKDGYICLFYSPSRKHVKFIELKQQYIDEARVARETFDYDSRERIVAFEQIVDSRVAEWSEVLSPSDFVEQFEDNISLYPSSYKHLFQGSFEHYRDAFEEYWDGCEYVPQTPFDDEPDEAYLREAYESFIERHRH